MNLFILSSIWISLNSHVSSIVLRVWSVSFLSFTFGDNVGYTTLAFIRIRVWVVVAVGFETKALLEQESLSGLPGLARFLLFVRTVLWSEIHSGTDVVQQTFDESLAFHSYILIWGPCLFLCWLIVVRLRNRGLLETRVVWVDKWFVRWGDRVADWRFILCFGWWSYSFVIAEQVQDLKIGHDLIFLYSLWL